MLGLFIRKDHTPLGECHKDGVSKEFVMVDEGIVRDSLVIYYYLGKNQFSPVLRPLGRHAHDPPSSCTISFASLRSVSESRAT